MKIIYVCDFDLSRTTGKDRATRQKTSALKEINHETEIISLTGCPSRPRIVNQFLLEVRSAIRIIKNRPDCVISRGFTGWLFQPVARIMGAVTAREIHADTSGELKLLPYSGLKLKAIGLLGSISAAVDRSAEIRIFNHPDLLDWYRRSYGGSGSDFYTYNGYSPSSLSSLSREDAIKKLKLEKNKNYLAFIGSASRWHGVEYLVDLQKKFNEKNDNIQIVCGGGDLKKYDPDGLCINITPLTDTGCAELVRASSLCLLPVKINRVSPGSPLKLYDYICNKRYIVSQANTNGYSDEVERYGVGISVDYSNPQETRDKIISALEATKNICDSSYPECDVQWKDRMRIWKSKIEEHINKHR